MHPLKLPTLSQPKANILVHPRPPRKKTKINPHIPGTVAAKKIDPGTNAPTETPTLRCFGKGGCAEGVAGAGCKGP